MRSKTSVFKTAVATCCYDVIIILETWYNASILNAEIAPDGWAIFHRDRYSDDDPRRGGGVLISTRDYLLPLLSKHVLRISSD